MLTIKTDLKIRTEGAHWTAEAKVPAEQMGEASRAFIDDLPVLVDAPNGSGVARFEMLDQLGLARLRGIGPMRHLL